MIERPMGYCVLDMMIKSLQTESGKLKMYVVLESMSYVRYGLQESQL